MRIFSQIAAALAATLGLAAAQEPLPVAQEFEPPGGVGTVVVVLSGQSGPAGYQEAARAVAAAGYDVFLVDGNDVRIKDGAGKPVLAGLIGRARQSPHAAPGKAAVIGFSLGGGVALAFATHLPEEVAAVVAVYPLTRFISHPDRFVGSLKAPTLVLAGVRDTYKDCCRIETARALAAAAREAGGEPRLEVVEYPYAAHGWNLRGSRDYREADAQDALRRALAHVARATGRPAPAP